MDWRIEMKHAYLIIAHNNPEILYAQIAVLQQPGTDFFYHLDEGMRFDQQKLKNYAQQSKVTFIESQKVRWGGYSQINCELRLLEAAIQGKYDYYHLLSGVDMPIKTKEEINDFFEKHKGKEFVHFDELNVSETITERISLYHLFPGRTQFRKKLNGVFVKFQKRLKVNRIEKLGWSVQKGANWFSITNDLAQYIVQNKRLIKKVFSYSFCGDEVFLQTMIYNSRFANKLFDTTYSDDYHACMRYIDWQRGNPYVFQKEDLEELRNSDFLFARKFNYEGLDDAVTNMVRILMEGGKEW